MQSALAQRSFDHTCLFPYATSPIRLQHHFGEAGLLASPSYRIVEYDQRWPVLYEEEKALVVAATGIMADRVEHIGSTAVPGLGAKPIIDMMVGVPSVEGAKRQRETLEGVGYEWRGETVPGTLYLRKAEPRRFNLHLTQWDGDFWLTKILFRDFLRTHPETARQYEDLKRELMAQLASDPPAYNDAKAAFIESVVQQARICSAGP